MSKTVQKARAGELVWNEFVVIVYGIASSGSEFLMNKFRKWTLGCRSWRRKLSCVRCRGSCRICGESCTTLSCLVVTLW